jgi:uncharacterized protein (DUF885 family)
MRFFQSNTFAPLEMIEQEVDRLSVWPGQATAYHVGYLAFINLRESTQSTQRTRFSLRDFHDRLFRPGPVPVDMLETVFNS